MAQEARKGTCIFRFGKKQDDVPSEETAEPTRPGTRLFRFGGPQKVADPEDDEDEEEKPFSGNFGTQIFKSFAKKKNGTAVGTVSGALVPVVPKEFSFSLPRRLMRQICVTKFFSNKRLEYFHYIRWEELHPYYSWNVRSPP